MKLCFPYSFAIRAVELTELQIALIPVPHFRAAVSLDLPNLSSTLFSEILRTRWTMQASQLLSRNVCKASAKKKTSCPESYAANLSRQKRDGTHELIGTGAIHTSMHPSKIETHISFTELNKILLGKQAERLAGPSVCYVYLLLVHHHGLQIVLPCMSPAPLLVNLLTLSQSKLSELPNPSTAADSIPT